MSIPTYLPNRKNHEKTPNKISQFDLYINMDFLNIVMRFPLSPTKVISSLKSINKDVVPLFWFWKQMDEIIVEKIEQVHGGMAKAPHLERMHIICNPKTKNFFGYYWSKNLKMFTINVPIKLRKSYLEVANHLILGTKS